MQNIDNNNEYGLISSSVNFKSSDTATKKTAGNVVYLYDDEQIPPVRRKPHYKDQSIDITLITKEEKRLLNYCFELILNANDENLYRPERSNCFDEWKERLIILSRQIDSLSNKQRKILGTLIASVLDKDISDFWDNKKAFSVLQEATNFLRFPGIAKSECKRVLDEIISLKLDNTLLPLSCDDIDASKSASLDSMYEYLLSKSR